ncbi:hypothetical protein [Antribacter gilvus]|uniref:hypothetical protein n=1 Tax=Antribacter gilvus TaxID=2304675 RepID=UPI00197F0B14|nr:hypothetical protein [Antribacter gilvus]
MSETAPLAKRPLKPYTRYLVLYLALTVGSVWALVLFYLPDYEFAVGLFGELELSNPLVVAVLNSPAIAAVIVLFLYDGFRGVLNFLRTLVPRPKDLLWIPALAAIMLAYVYAVRGVCLLFGIPVPPDPENPLEMAGTFFGLFLGEVGMLAIAMGWFGFFLPLMHRVTGSHIRSGIATGLGIGIFVAPGNLFSSFELATAWPLYVTQLSVLGIGMSFLLSRMKGNVLFFLVPFWVSASGSHWEMYVFMTPTQLVQMVLFGALVVLLWFVLKRQAGGELDPPFVFPEYLENEYTVRTGAVFPGVGNKSKELDPAPSSEPELTGARHEETA